MQQRLLPISLNPPRSGWRWEKGNRGESLFLLLIPTARAPQPGGGFTFA